MEIHNEFLFEHNKISEQSLTTFLQYSEMSTHHRYEQNY